MSGAEQTHLKECAFCRILAGKAEASFVYRDERIAAFMDIRPITPGHLLIIPTRHEAHPHGPRVSR